MRGKTTFLLETDEYYFLLTLDHPPLFCEGTRERAHSKAPPNQQEPCEASLHGALKDALKQTGTLNGRLPKHPQPLRLLQL